MYRYKNTINRHHSLRSFIFTLFFCFSCVCKSTCVVHINENKIHSLLISFSVIYYCIYITLCMVNEFSSQLLNISTLVVSMVFNSCGDNNRCQSMLLKLMSYFMCYISNPIVAIIYSPCSFVLMIS